MKMTKKMQQCSIIYCSLAALHVSSDTFAQHQEHLNCIYSLWYYNTRGCKYNLDAPDDERKYRWKHVEQPKNNKLSYRVTSCWSFSYIVSWCTEPWISIVKHFRKMSVYRCATVVVASSCWDCSSRISLAQRRVLRVQIWQPETSATRCTFCP
jgi:hypothetical protein